MGKEQEGKVEKQVEETRGWYVPIEKIDDEKKLVYGIVYEPNNPDVDGDFASAETIQNAAHEFLASYRTIKSMHKETLSKEDAEIVESYIALTPIKFGERNVKKGSWILVMKIHNEKIWSDIKEGKYIGYSFGGRAKREKV